MCTTKNEVEVPDSTACQKNMTGFVEKAILQKIKRYKVKIEREVTRDV